MPSRRSGAATANGDEDDPALAIQDTIGTLVFAVIFPVVAIILALVERITKKSIQELCGCVVPGGGAEDVLAEEAEEDEKHEKYEMHKEPGENSALLSDIKDIHRMLTELSRAEPHHPSAGTTSKPQVTAEYGYILNKDVKPPP
ncbi:hypothetical protein T484DRAFT_1910345 [Baffinella frigidus]|nr:hypothetical protein T484DRAFT_1910345 [Cryptophyta sp. CCMP2293]